jgi:hypothetical protein
MDRRAFILVYLAGLSSCSPPQFQPRQSAGPLAVAELIQRADAIIVGAVSKVGIAAPLTRDQCLVLMRAEILVENVLKGDIAQRTVDYFSFSSVCAIVGPIEVLHIGSRYIFFLRREQRYWRSVEDYWRNTVPVKSGGHPSEFATGKPIEQAISEILLIPGDGYSASSFAEALQTQAAPIARTLTGSVGTDRLARLLLSHPDMGIRTAACLVLKQDQAADGCTDPILSWYFDRFAKGNFVGISAGVVWRLQFLVAYAGPQFQSRSEYLLYQARLATTLPGPPEVTPPDVLVR